MGGGLPHLGHDERTEQPGGLLAQDALGHPDQADAAVEDMAHVEAGVGPADDGADEVTQQEGPELVHHRSDDLGPIGLGHGLVGVPEPAEADRVIRDSRHSGGSEGVVGEQAGDVREAGRGTCAGRVAQQGQARRAEHIVGARPPKGGEYGPEDADQVVDDEVGVGAGEDV